MSLSRSPSPHPGGGWSSPGLTPGSGPSTPRSSSTTRVLSSRPPNGLTWTTAKAKSDEVRGYPSFSTRNSGFFSRQKRILSSSLPRLGGKGEDYEEGWDQRWERGRGKGGRGSGRGERAVQILGSAFRRKRLRVLVAVVLVWIGYLLFGNAIAAAYRRSPLRGARKFVTILGSNVEGGVMEWKGAAEWAIERNSVWNKEEYTGRWGYEFEVVNMLAKKRYSHEWREGWEKIDIIRDAMRKYPNAEWFWWLDLNTWIMEYSYSLQNHIFDDLDSRIYRDINFYNPLNITHPPTAGYLDSVSQASGGDKDPSSINLILSQDCGGFNLGSFFVRRSAWTDRLLDIWWDPVLYEQKHMEWEHGDQSALEYLYQSQPWLRNGVGFLPQRYINSFPPGACGEEPDPRFHYEEDSRDFVVNMAGCQYGRDCWGEMVQYGELSEKLNRSWWARWTSPSSSSRGADTAKKGSRSGWHDSSSA